MSKIEPILKKAIAIRREKNDSKMYGLESPHENFVSFIDNLVQKKPEIYIEKEISFTKYQMFNKVESFIESVLHIAERYTHYEPNVEELKTKIKDYLFFEDKEFIIKGRIRSNNNEFKLIKFIQMIYGVVFSQEDLDNLSHLIDTINCVSGKHNKIVISTRREDLLLISDITENWRSCQSMFAQRWLANVSYITDECTYVGLVINSKGQKVWRELAYVFKSPELEAIYFSRCYPQFNDGVEIYHSIFYREFCKYIFGDENYQETNSAVFDLEGKDRNHMTPYIDDATVIAFKKKSSYKSERLSFSPKSTMMEIITQIPCIKCGNPVSHDLDYCGSDFRHSGFCPKCMSCKCERIKCFECGEMVLKTNAQQVSDEVFVCSLCADTKYERCSQCGKYEKPDTLTKVSGTKVCSECYKSFTKKCSICGEIELSDVMYPLRDDKNICKKCAKEKYIQCSNCGELTEKLYLIKNGDYNFCNQCFNLRTLHCVVCDNNDYIKNMEIIKKKIMCVGCASKFIKDYSIINKVVPGEIK